VDGKEENEAETPSEMGGCTLAEGDGKAAGVICGFERRNLNAYG
jgi:hypothetical protein